jgi:hypothetical protein
MILQHASQIMSACHVGVSYKEQRFERSKSTGGARNFSRGSNFHAIQRLVHRLKCVAGDPGRCRFQDASGS